MCHLRETGLSFIMMADNADGHILWNGREINLTEHDGSLKKTCTFIH